MSPGNTSLPPLSKERITELEIFRGLAFLAVVFQHSLGYYAQAQPVGLPEAAMLGMILHFTKFAVPGFVFVTGAVLFYNYYESLSYPAFIKKRTLDILVPYLVWTCIYEYYLNGLPKPGEGWIKEFSKTVVSGTEIYHLWFVIMIFQFYLFYPLILQIFKKARGAASSRTRLFTAIALVAGCYTWLMWASHSYIPSRGFSFSSPVLQTLLIEYRDRNFLFYSFYFILGGLAGVSIARWRNFISRSISWNVFLFAGLFVIIGYELLSGSQTGGINMNISTPLKPSMFFYTVSEILLVYGLALAIAARGSVLTRFLALAGKYSYGGYLCHALILLYAVKKTGAIIPPGHSILSSVLSFVLCALGSLFITYLLGFIPYSRLIIGPVDKKELKDQPLYTGRPKSA